ncbi:Forkhead-associated (FHA) phosphopeptide binding domain 1 [Porites harrisoni]
MHCACTALEEELTLVEELTTHDSLSWIKDFVCKTLSNEAVWQRKAEDALKRATGDSDSGLQKWRRRIRKSC